MKKSLLKLKETLNLSLRAEQSGAWQSPSYD